MRAHDSKSKYFEDLEPDERYEGFFDIPVSSAVRVQDRMLALRESWAAHGTSESSPEPSTEVGDIDTEVKAA